MDFKSDLFCVEQGFYRAYKPTLTKAQYDYYSTSRLLSQAKETAYGCKFSVNFTQHLEQHSHYKQKCQHKYKLNREC